MKNREFYLGLDIGTDSVGYAATDESYTLLKCKGEPMWGAHLFEPANQSAERRGYRSARRRLDRRQQRVFLIESLFAAEIQKIDPRFFIRRRESALYRSDVSNVGDRYPLFNEEEYTDREFYHDYPTIHHLICALMESDEPHDVRLVYLACAWLVAHRGHFLSEVDRDNLDNVRELTNIYQAFLEFFVRNELPAPWNCASEDFGDILKKKMGVMSKEKAFFSLFFGGKKPKENHEDAFPYSRAGMIRLLSGGKVAPRDLFRNEAYTEISSLSLGMKDEDLAAILGELGDDAEIILHLKALYDWGVLIDVLAGKATVSEAKVAVYEQHKTDLRELKRMIRKYRPEKYNELFRQPRADGYAAYTQNFKSIKREKMPAKKPSATKEAFSKYLLSIVKPIQCEDADKPFFDDMLRRLEVCSFLPKQIDPDNRVIPHQLYWYELKTILARAAGYLPFLHEEDGDGLRISDKILAVFLFRVPYFVGPLNTHSDHAWVERKAGKIYPWNFDDMVDLDQSEQAFIDRMTNTCTYLPGEPVLPKHSFCYCRFNVLNEINNLKINGQDIPVELKQAIYEELFTRYARVTPKRIVDFCLSNGYAQKGDTISGIDITIKSSLKPQLDFRRLLEAGTLSEADAERIIERITYTEDRARFLLWLKDTFPSLGVDDVRYISRLKYDGFGRLSRRMLCEMEGVDTTTGECGTIMHFLWSSNANLMQLLSERYSFASEIEALRAAYYQANPKGLSDRLDEMYISNAVKRPIIRALDVVKEVVKACGQPPEKIFVEMARGASPDQKGKRTKTRCEQLRLLYEKIHTDEVRALSAQLDEMGDRADNRLQSEALFLYYLQLGKCMYSGEPIQVDKLKDGTYNIEHIYPQSMVKDDSLTNNKVLVLSQINGVKSNQYPVPADIRRSMQGYWEQLQKLGLISEEKLRRLTRATSFTADEKMGFINRQLVETRQSTKAIASLLGELYPQTQIVYVKAGLVSDFRHAYDLLKSRAINDLHHAKDAYLNIVVGNVYTERFSKRWFSVDEAYSVKTTALFGRPLLRGERCIWEGETSITTVKKTMSRNNIHNTRYAFCRKGGYFDQQPLAAKEGLVPRKADLDPAKYGGYNKPTATFFIAARYVSEKKRDIMIVPIELLCADRFLADSAFAARYVQDAISNITGKPSTNIEFPLGLRPLKVNTLFCFDGFRACLGSKSSGGKRLGLIPLMPFKTDMETERYIKALESFAEKQKINPRILADSQFDKLTRARNEQLYDLYTSKLSIRPYALVLDSQQSVLQSGRAAFCALPVEAQAACLLQIQALFKTGRTSGCDLTAIGGSANAGVITVDSKISNWKNKYNEVYIIDASAAGLFEKRSVNLLELL